MCCFSRHVELVSNTNIFARSSNQGRQFVVYSMSNQTKEDLAMILPKLKEGEAKKQQKVHPMAFEFPRANPKKMFFPTVHIHDSKVHPEAEFDHTLYCQTTGGESLPMMDWVESVHLASQFLKIDKTEGIVDGKSHCHVRAVRGKRKNEDILV